MSDSWQPRTLALAGVFQAAGLTRALARQGRTDHETAAETSLASVFVTDPASVAEVYGGPAGVAWGLRLLRDQLRSPGREPADMELARYVIALTVLERKLARNNQAREALGEGIEGAMHTYRHFGAAHANVRGRLADLYQEHVSTLGPRVQVRGNSDILQDPANIARIRAYLLAGLRAAVLWRQAGGRRWQLIFRRARYLRAAEDLLATAVGP